MNVFDKVIGYEAIKEELLQIVDMIRNPARYEKLGAVLPRGVLLYGEPGLGKTIMAEAFIAEAGLPVYTIRKTRAKESLMEAITEAFQQAVQSAPAVVFIDDMDKLANEDFRHCDADEYVAVQAEIDETKTRGVFVIATANDIERLPDSLLRAGRFDRRIEVKTPTQKDAEEIIRYYLQNKPVDQTVSVRDLAKMVSFKSCAVLETILNEAAVYAAYAGKEAIGMTDLGKAVLRQEYDGPEKPQDIPEEKKRRIALHEAAHAVTAERLAPGCVGMLSIRKGDHAGMMHLCGEDPSMEDTAKISLAGRAAEEMYYPNSPSVGSMDDISKAAEAVKVILTEQMAFGFGLLDAFKKSYIDPSPMQTYRLETMIQSVVERYQMDVYGILQADRDFLIRLSERLYEKGTLLYTEIQEIKKHSKRGGDGYGKTTRQMYEE